MLIIHCVQKKHPLTLLRATAYHML